MISYGPLHRGWSLGARASSPGTASAGPLLRIADIFTSRSGLRYSHTHSPTSYPLASRPGSSRFSCLLPAFSRIHGRLVVTRTRRDDEQVNHEPFEEMGRNHRV